METRYRLDWQEEARQRRRGQYDWNSSDEAAILLGYDRTEANNVIEIQTAAGDHQGTDTAQHTLTGKEQSRETRGELKNVRAKAKRRRGAIATREKRNP